jgi:hypothetical protein
MNIKPLIDRWQTDEGKPYKGSLIDMDAYLADPTNPGCMCAQGQVLHYAGWDADLLNHADQKEADREVAKLLNISNSHAILLRIINDAADGAPATVLTDPGAVLGDHWSKVLDFWWYLDTMTGAAWVAAQAAAWAAAGEAAGAAARRVAGAAALKAAGAVARAAALKAAGAVARAAALEAAQAVARAATSHAVLQAAGKDSWQSASQAAWEIQGAEIMRRDGNPFYFLPSFGFASPDDIPARPADYGPFTGE